MAKPVYHGTYEEYQALPQTIRGYYQPPKQVVLPYRKKTAPQPKRLPPPWIRFVERKDGGLIITGLPPLAPPPTHKRRKTVYMEKKVRARAPSPYSGSYEEYQVLPWDIRRYYQSPQETRIQTQYQQAPLVWHTPTPEEPYAYVKQPTQIQEQRILEAAKRLPPETRKKYIVEPKPQPTWKETTATGQIMEKGYVWKTGARLHMGPKIYEMTPEQQKKVLAKTTSLRYAGAGFVSIAEQWGGFIGKPTPPGPISGVIGLAIGQPKAWQEYVETPLEYKAGQVPAMVLESALLGVGLGYAWSGAKRIVPEVIKQPLAKGAKAVTRTVKFSRVAKVAHKAKLWYIEHKPWVSKAKYVAKGEVAPPMFAKEPLSLAKLKAVETAWLMETMPRTSAVTLGKVASVTAKGKPIPHMIIQKVAGQWKVTGPIVLRELSFEEPIWKRGLLPFVTQTQVTRMGIMPYIPKVVVSTGKKAVSTFALGLGVSTVAKIHPSYEVAPRLVAPPVQRIKRRGLLIPKVWQPTLAREREKFRPLTIFETEAKQRERLVPALKLPSALTFEQPPTQITPPITVQPPTLKPPTLISPPTTTRPPPFYPRIPRGGFDISRGQRGLFGRWFKREHAIATPRQVATSFFGFGKPPRKRKGKGKRRKGGVFSWF